MLKFVVVRPGSTDFDEQGRIKGALDIPLNENGTHQVERTVQELTDIEIDYLYTSPNQSARETAERLAVPRRLKVKELKGLHNLDHGLWQGKLIEEVRQKQPKVYRQWQEHPETVCPPDGESLDSAKQRVAAVLTKLIKKHRSGVVAIVVPEPLASLMACYLSSSKLGNLWQCECDRGTWELITFEPGGVAQSIHP